MTGYKGGDFCDILFKKILFNNLDGRQQFNTLALVKLHVLLVAHTCGLYEGNIRKKKSSHDFVAWYKKIKSMYNLRVLHAGKRL